MAEPADAPVPYRVAYSGRVRDQIRALVQEARDRGMFQQAVDALREIDRRLHVYPQFGQPLRDLQLEEARLWIGVVAPVVVEYVIEETTRHVIVVAPFRLLPHRW